VERTGALPKQTRFETIHVDLEVSPVHSGVCNQRIRDIEVPEDALIALLRRGERVVVPRGFTRVEPGDVLTLITTRAHESSLRAWIASGMGRV
jgi:Trk K+ transport system NAD-binding subunit